MNLAQSTMRGYRPFAGKLVPSRTALDYGDFVDEVETLLPNMRRYARALTRNPDDADDLVQDALVSALAKWRQFHRGTNLRAWLFRIIRNAHCDRFRSRQRQATVPLYEDQEFPTEGNQEHYVQCGEVARAFARLPTRSREVISLVVFEGMRYEQAAEILGVRVGTVRSRLSRARSMLSDALS